MDSYSIGILVGKLIFWILLFGMFYGIYRLWKNILGGLFTNPTQRLLKEYLWWVDFVQDIHTADGFKKKLGKIKSKKLYKDELNNFYLTKNEASSLNVNAKVISVKEILKSETYPLFLINRLERLTLYDKQDLKNITKSSKMVWIQMGDIWFHMIIDGDKFIYPKDYDISNPYRFGYTNLHDKSGLMGIYDVGADKLVLPFEYKYIKSFGNIVEVSIDEKIYEIIDLKTNEVLEKNDHNIFPNISEELKKKIDLSKIELADFIKLCQPIKIRYNLEQIGLWGAKVGVLKVPSHFEDILEDPQSGTIEWNHYCSADLYDMSIELPVNFKKKNGEYVSLGIDPKYLILEKEDRKRLIL